MNLLLESPVKRRFFLIISVIQLIYVSYSTYAQHVQSSVQMAMGGSVVALKGIDGVFQNPALLVGVKQWGVTSTYENRFLLKELSTRLVGVAYNHQAKVIALKGASFGYADYRKNTYGIVLAMPLSDKTNAGIEINNHSLYQSELRQTTHRFSVGMGIKTMLDEQIFLHAYVFNPMLFFRKEYAFTTSFFITGLSYNWSAVELVAEFEKQYNEKPFLKTGLAYKLHEQCVVYTGFSTQYTNGSLGLKYLIKSFEVSFACMWHPYLGPTTTCTLVYAK